MNGCGKIIPTVVTLISQRLHNSRGEELLANNNFWILPAIHVMKNWKRSYVSMLLYEWTCLSFYIVTHCIRQGHNQGKGVKLHWQPSLLYGHCFYNSCKFVMSCKRGFSRTNKGGHPIWWVVYEHIQSHTINARGHLSGTRDSTQVDGLFLRNSYSNTTRAGGGASGKGGWTQMDGLLMVTPTHIPQW